MKKQHILFLDFLFISVLVILLGFSYLSYQRIEKLRDSSDWVNHSNIVKLKVNQVLINILDAENGQRGYILTHDDRFLEQYKIAFSNANTEIASVILLTRQSGTQNELAKDLQRTIKSRFSMFNTIIRDGDDGNYSASELDTMLLKGKITTDRIRVMVADIINAEDRLLRLRIKEKEQAGAFTPIVVLLFSVFAIMLVIAAYIRLRTEIHLRMTAQSSEASARKLQMQSIEHNVLLEKKVSERTHELEKKNLLLENMNDELLSFNYVASHDLQEPLRKIQAFANRIMDTEQNFSETSKDYFLRISSAASRMQKLLEALISYSRATNSDQDFTPTDLNQLLEEVKSDLHEAIDEKKVVITNSGLPVLDVIGHQFHQLFVNLIMNAIKYSKPGIPPKINISAQIIDVENIKKSVYLHSKGFWKIAFEDNGIGFDKEFEERIFELFQRLHGKHEFEGTGIGLAICRKIAQNHNGYIFAEGRPEEGSTFFICLPITP